jgi:hypothetical protein
MKKMMIHRVAFCCSWNESFACWLLDSFFSRNDVVMKRKNHNNCEVTFSNDFIVVEKLDFFFIFFTFHVSKQFNLLTTRSSFRYFERQYSRYSRDWELFVKNEWAHFFYSLNVVFVDYFLFHENSRSSRSHLLRNSRTKILVFSSMWTLFYFSRLRKNIDLFDER